MSASEYSRVLPDSVRKRTDSALVAHLRAALEQAVRDGRTQIARELTAMIVAERESTRCWGRQ